MALRPADGVLLGAALLVQGALLQAYWTPRQPGTVAIVHTPAGEQRLDLSRAGLQRVEGALGTSVLEIAEGQIRFAQSPCRRKVCIHSGWQSQAGHSTACVPNRVSVQIPSTTAPRFDALHY